MAVRCDPSESVDDLVEEYGRTNPEIEEAIRWERAQPIAARGVCTVPRGKFAQLPADSNGAGLLWYQVLSVNWTTGQRVFFANNGYQRLDKRTGYC